MKPGTYYWTEWKREVEVGMSQAFSWKSGKLSRGKTLCVLPFPGFPNPIKITPNIAGEFHGPVPRQK